MIHALVSTRLYGVGTFKLRGDVIIAAVEGFDFGVRSPLEFLICEIDDQNVEDRLTDGEREFIQFPYDSGDEIDDPDYSRSTMYVDIDALDDNLRSRLLDEEEPVELIPWSVIQPVWKQRVE